MSHVNIHMDIAIVSIRVVQPLFSRDMGFNSSGTISWQL
jgi:hypothetical protein